MVVYHYNRRTWETAGLPQVPSQSELQREIGAVSINEAAMMTRQLRAFALGDSIPSSGLCGHLHTCVHKHAQTYT